MKHKIIVIFSLNINFQHKSDLANQRNSPKTLQNIKTKSLIVLIVQIYFTMNKEDEKKKILNDLISATKEVINVSKDNQLVTENRQEVEKLLNIFEDVLLFGLKSSNSFLDNLQELVNVQFTSSNSNIFWNFAYQHLTKDEQKRFSSYKNVNKFITFLSFN